MDEVGEVSVAGGTIRLGQLLKLASFVENGSDVRPLLASGGVRVDGEVETRRGAQLTDGALVSVDGVGAVRLVGADRSQIPTTARAVRYDGFGGREVLRVEEVAMPVPGDGEALVAVRATGINPGEAMLRTGAMAQMFPSTFPSGQGSDLAGVVLALGGGDAAGFAVGDEVLGWVDTRSAHATHAVVPAAQLVPKPVALPFEVAGALFVAGTTAWAAVQAVDPQPEETVLVSAAAGGVGSIVVQLLAERGVAVVGIASTANAVWLADHGAVPVEHGDGLEERVRAAAPDGVDAVIDLFGPQYLDLALALGVDPQRTATIISFERAGQVGAKVAGSAQASTAEVLASLAARVAQGGVEVPIAATYPLDAVADAFAELERRHARGKIVLLP